MKLLPATAVLFVAGLAIALGAYALNGTETQPPDSTAVTTVADVVDDVLATRKLVT